MGSDRGLFPIPATMTCHVRIVGEDKTNLDGVVVDGKRATRDCVYGRCKGRMFSIMVRPKMTFSMFAFGW
jgi:hypothetical protein